MIKLFASSQDFRLLQTKSILQDENHMYDIPKNIKFVYL